MLMKSAAGCAALLMLAACGGGTTSAPKFDPVVASGGLPPATLGDLAGTTFPLRLAYLDTSGATPVPVRTEWGLRIVSDTEVVLITPDEEVTLLAGASGFAGLGATAFYTLGDAGAGFDWSTVVAFKKQEGLWVEANGGGHFGLETSQARLDDLEALNSVATYSGTSGMQFYQNGSITDSDGTSSLEIDFGTGDVSGFVHKDGDFTMDIVNGSLSGSGFHGTLSLSGPKGPLHPLSTSAVDGTIYGTGATEILGSFEGAGTGPVGPYVFVGVYTAN